MNKLLVVFAALFCVQAAIASDIFETGRPIIQLAQVGGFVPISFSANQIPEIKIWEDGTVIVTSFQGLKRKVLFSTIKTDEIAHLNSKMKDSGFMSFHDSYTGENAPTDLPSTCIKFWSTETKSKQVCDYYNGAPEFFRTMTTYLRTVKDRVIKDGRPFYPVAGYVKAYPESFSKDAVAYNGPKISTSGTWITDLQTIAKLWDAVNNNQLLTDCPNNAFRVSVQVEDLSVQEPPATKPLPGNDQRPKANATVIVRFVALGLSGLMFILGVVLLVRIVRRRRQQQQQQQEHADEVPMVETPSHSTSVYEHSATAMPQYVATQQWAGQPAYVNTTPQYMVYYMQPTQTQQ